MVTYNDLCSEVIKKKITALGREKALEALKDLNIDMGPDVDVKNATKETLESIVKAYKKITGKVGVIFARSAISSLIEGQNIDLPEILK